VMRTTKSILFALPLVLFGLSAASAGNLTAPSYLFMSGSARLLGMGDASVAVVDATGYNTNPGTLALAFEDMSLIASFRPGTSNTSNGNFGNSFVAIGGQPLFRKTSRWRFALSFVNQSVLVPYLYSGRPDTEQNISGEVYGGTPYYQSGRPRESTRTITLGLMRKGKTEIGLGISARDLRLDASRVWYRNSSDKPIEGWNFDLGAIARWKWRMDFDSKPDGKSLVVSPSVGVSCLGLFRTDVTGLENSLYLSEFELSREPLSEAPASGTYVGSTTFHAGAAMTIGIVWQRLALVEYTTSLEHQSGSGLADGIKAGEEIRVFESGGIRFGYGVLGSFEDVLSWGFTLSTAGLQKMLFREPADPGGATDRNWLIRRLHFSISFATTTNKYQSDLPKKYWTISVSL
jgi:hypothetical protein